MIYKDFDEQEEAGKALHFMLDRVPKTGHNEPDIFHSIRVGLAGDNITQVIVGFLHDTIEDTDCTKENIAKEFGDEIAAKVDALTIKVGDFYDEYIKKIAESTDDDIKSVKLNDIEDNVKRGYASGFPCLVAKHLMAYKIIVYSLSDGYDKREAFLNEWLEKLEG